MSFDWTAYLDLAEQLAAKPPEPKPPSEPQKETSETRHSGSSDQQRPPTEAALRTAVSRAYYAAFHVARTYLDGQGRLQDSKHESHTTVWNSFSQGGRLEGRIKVDGFRLLNARKGADYTQEPNFADKGRSDASSPAEVVKHWQASAESAIRGAKTVLSLLRDLQRRH